LSAEYLTHSTIPDNGHFLGGGLRIKKIENYTHENQLANSKLFSYEGDFGWSSGKLLAPVNYIQNFDYSISNSSISIRDIRSLYSDDPVTDIGSSAQGKSIGYDKVSVKEINHLSEGLYGRKDFFYKNELENVLFSPAGIIPNDVPLDNGQLTREEHYNSNGTLVYKKEPNYTKDIRGNIEVKGVSLAYDEALLFTLNDTNIYNMYIQEYSIKSEWWYMDSEKETVYDVNGNNPVAKTTNYIYGNEIHKQPTEISTTSSKGENFITKNEYPSDHPTGTDMSTSLFNDMISKNILNPILKQEITTNGVKAEGIITNYTKETNSLGGDMYLPTTIKTLKKGTVSDYENRIMYHNYDENGNPKEVSKLGGVHIYYIWGYQGEYPIAKIENFTATQANNIQGLITDAENASNLDTSTSRENILRQKLNLIRNNPSLINAVMTSFTYDPLIGITSVTDPKGYTMYYDYDTQNRLNQIKDNDGNIITEHNYNYKH